MPVAVQDAAFREFRSIGGVSLLPRHHMGDAPQFVGGIVVVGPGMVRIRCQQFRAADQADDVPFRLLRHHLPAEHDPQARKVSIPVVAVFRAQAAVCQALPCAVRSLPLASTPCYTLITLPASS